MANIGTPTLLNTTSLDGIIDSVEVVKETFKDESSNRSIDYNQLVLHLANGDKVNLKLSPANKASIYVALMVPAEA